MLKVPSVSEAAVKEEIGKMLQEARLFASISNPHIVRYNHSWLETIDYSVDDKREGKIELESPFIGFESEEKSSEGELEEDSYSENEGDSEVKVSLFIQMELCRETLEDYLSRRTATLTEDEYEKSLGIAGQLISGIYAMHRDYKIIHRDLSLRNIFIGKDNVIKLGDFGLATKKHFIPVVASPFSIRPKDSSEEEEPKLLKLESNSDICSSGDLSTQDLNECRLTNGIGTRTFSAPEQLSEMSYDQKADIYSLGLILLVLFNPTETLSERYQILSDCRKQGPSKEFLARHPEIGELIKRMADKDPATRPTAEELKKFPLFRGRENPAPNGWSELDLKGQKCLVRIGEDAKVKTRYIKLVGGNLLLYPRKGDKKAKFCYPLRECRVVTGGDNGSKGHIRRNMSLCSLSEEWLALGNSTKITIEHSQLQTLHVFLRGCSFKFDGKNDKGTFINP